MRENFAASGSEPTPFLSIPHSFWWALVTMATVGYGDFVPTSVAGRCIGAVAIVFGVLMLAMPITVVCMSFANEFSKWQREENAKVTADRRVTARIALELFDAEEAASSASARDGALLSVASAAEEAAAAAADSPQAGAAAASPSAVERLKRVASDSLMRGLSARYLLTLKSQALEQQEKAAELAPEPTGGE